MLAAAGVVAALTGTFALSIIAQGDTHTGDVFGDLIHIKRDAMTGQPILQKRQVLLPGDVLDWAYCQIPVDVTGWEIPFLPQSCDPDPAYATSIVPVDYFGRLSGGRTQERNQRMHFDEAIIGIKAAQTVTLDEAGRIRLGMDCTAVGVCASWRTIDSPMENLSIYNRVVRYGHVQTDPLEEDTSPGGDPEEGTVYHPALDASDWAKFIGPVTALLPRASSSECFSGTAFDLACAVPTALTSVDFFLSGAVLAGAADKTGRVTPDLVQYLNRILKVTLSTPTTAATLNTVPALVRDANGVIAPAPAGLPAPADERFVDFAPASYLRSDWFSQSVLVLQPSGGVFVPTSVNLMTWLNLINGLMPVTATTMPSFLRSSSDALRVVQFLHEYEIPSDLWAGPAATTTTVAPRTVTVSPNDQNVGLTASVISQSPTPVSGTITFSVRTVLSVAVGVPVTVPVVNGTAGATYVLPGGTPAQTLTIAALFTPAGPFASSVGTGTLTVGPAPTGDVILNGTFDDGAAGWLPYATPDSSHIVWSVTNGVLEFYWVPPAPGESGQATIFQETGLALSALAPITAQFDLGNSSSVRKRISVVLTDADFSDRMLCTFWLPANTPLRSYSIRTHATRAWTNAAIYFYAATAGSDGGFYQLDNVSLFEDPTSPTDATYCVDPTAPAAPGGAESASLLVNGDFTTGLTPWVPFGQITTQIAAGVLEFVRPAGVPAGVILQTSTQPLPAAAILTARFDLGNSSSVRKRVTVMLHDANFTDLAACMFWLEPGQPLSTHVMRAFATQAWTAAAVSIYPGTIDAEPWTRLDNVSLTLTPAEPILGTECLEPGHAEAAVVSSAGLAAPLAATAPMDAGAQEWQATTGFSRIPEAAFGGTGLGWAAVASQAGRQLLWWTRPIDLQNALTARLRFRSRLVGEASAASVEVCRDGTTWHTLAAVPPSDDWTLLEADLSAFAGEVVFIRFALDTPVAPTAAPDVWWVDEIEVHIPSMSHMRRSS